MKIGKNQEIVGILAITLAVDVVHCGNIAKARRGKGNFEMCTTYVTEENILRL